MTPKSKIVTCRKHKARNIGVVSFFGKKHDVHCRVPLSSQYVLLQYGIVIPQGEPKKTVAMHFLFSFGPRVLCFAYRGVFGCFHEDEYTGDEDAGEKF